MNIQLRQRILLMVRLLSLFIFIFSLGATYAKVIKIPLDYATIQEGIDNADEGDTVLVSSGIYFEQLKLRGNNIILKGELGAESTIIEGSFLPEQDSLSLLYIFNGENEQTVIEGFTFRYGQGTYINQYRKRQGGAIYCSESSFTLKGSIFIENSGYEGGAIYYGDSESSIDDCEFRANTAGFGGGAIYSIFSNISITNSLFVENTAESFGGCYMGKFSELNCVKTIMYKGTALNGGAIHSDHVNLNFCTIVNNVAELGAGGGILCEEGIIQNSILYFNNSTSNNNQIYPANSPLIVEYCDIKNGWSGTGNIETDPLFVNLINEDFLLNYNSPCIDAGDPNSLLDPDGTRADIGAVFFNQLPNSAVFPIVLEFPNVNIGSSEVKVFTISNIYDSTLTISNFELNSEVFFTGNITPFSIPVEESINIDVTFTPMGVQEYNDSLVINSNYNLGNVLLKGNGIVEYSGTVSGIWEKSYNPIIVIDDIIVPSNDTLVIEHGVIVKVMKGKKITINGLLLAKGNVEDSIYFTNFEPTDNWWGMQFINSPNGSSLKYCVIEGANSDDNIAGNNNPEESGGGIYCINSNLAIINSKITNNRAAPIWSFGDGFGGGIYSNDSYIMIDSCEISNNLMSHSGGGIYSINSDLFIRNSTIYNNHHEEFAIYGNSAGAGVYVEGGQVQIVNNLISSNYNHGYLNPGGGITITNCEYFFVENNNIKDNSADIGGGIFISSSSGNINYNEISHNTAYDGGGLYIEESVVNVQKNIIHNNTVYEEGGGVYIYSDDVNLINNTISYNVADCNDCSSGGGIFILNNHQNNNIKNCIIFGNDANSNYDIKGEIQISYSLLRELAEGDGNIIGDPIFIDSFILGDDSPCIDAGDPQTIFNDIEDPDNIGFALYPAKGTLRNDMGAYGGKIVSDSIISATKEIKNAVPLTFDLEQNYPNPFNPMTNIRFAIPENAKVSLEVYNIIGEQVAELINEFKTTGRYEIEFDASGLASGVYIYIITANDFHEVKKMILLK
ncbi:MAG: right-handed parallel beta-helix repeat-containing protein [Melioribacteraceae bacterium]|nr:right-handed parallel beta-helix repeat-containing protein [Melioribacteraceae bacterium]MCF8354256.1 right-handed parallel beta-helix repeat-containing protein [Melioribacteraceae bacterium]MCF8394820.1 right-handed parallel beta-helix repeat-containing protein [Melioribacteraceae bacterium]MCF8417987.1 right-handed parallel beta-helix repeat-containing protein [Melioribacteraceae bacterium]